MKGPAFLTFVVVVGMAGAPSAAAQQSAVALVLDAMSREQAAPRERTEIIFVHSQGETRMLTERTAPDRLRVLVQGPRGERQEAVTIGDQLYSRSAGPWRRGSLALKADLIPSVATLLARRLVEAQRTPGGNQLQIVQGRITWPRVDGPNTGLIKFEISTATGLPRRTTFVGQCADQPCRFDQTFNFDQPIVIEPPL